MKTKLFIVVAGLVAFSLIPAQLDAANRFYLFGKLDMTQKAGKSSDYVAGTSDFCMTSGYKLFGAGLGYQTGTSFLFGLEAHYNMASNATMTDPSDSDTVEIDTYSSIQGFLYAGYALVKTTNLSLNLLAGGGIDYLMGAEDATYTSQKGYETQILVPEKKYAVAGFGGLSVDYFFTSNIGLTASARFTYIAAERPRSVINLLVGLVFGR